MAIEFEGFSKEIEAANILADAKASDVPEVVALEDRLREGQVYLSVGEVFSTDLVDQAFVSPDGVDLRGPLVLQNLKTAVNLCNWLDTDTIMRTCWALNRDLADELDQVAEFPNRDRAWVKSVFGRLSRENPTPASLDEAVRRMDPEQGAPEPARMLSTLPANQWLLQESQIVLRMWFITRVARDYTAWNQKISEVWYQTANEREPIARSDFERVFQVQLDGIGSADRGLKPGIGGNFFKELGKSISKLFRKPLAFFRSAFEEIGKGLQLAAKPLEWLEKLPYGHFLGTLGFGFVGSIVLRLTDQFGRALEEATINAFNEQEFITDHAKTITEVGTILTIAGAIVAVIPCGVCQAIGTAMAVAGMIMVAVGQGLLAVQRAIREQRLFDKLAALPVPKVPAAAANRANNEDDAGTELVASGGSSGNGLFVLLALAAGLH